MKLARNKTMVKHVRNMVESKTMGVTVPGKMGLVLQFKVKVNVKSKSKSKSKTIRSLGKWAWFRPIQTSTADSHQGHIILLQQPHHVLCMSCNAM